MSVIMGVIAVVVILNLVFAISCKVNENLKNLSFMIKNFNRAVELSRDEALTPAGGESVCRLKLEKDFPEFNIEVSRQIVRSALGAYFTVLSSKGGTQKLEEHCTEALVSEAESLALSDAKEYQNVAIAKTVITDYRKSRDEAVVTFQSAVGYKTDRDKQNQYIYEIKYVYFLTLGAEGENASLVCQNCGAEVSSMGEKVCEYCGSVINASVERTWKVSAIKKIKTAV